MSLTLDALCPDRDGPARSAYRGAGDPTPAEQTLERTRPAWARAGLTRVADITGLDCLGIPVATAHRPMSRSLSVAQGKGISWPDAAASAVMEALEGWHAERVDRNLRLASYADLASPRVEQDARPIDPAQLSRPLDSTWEPELTMLWVSGHELVSAAPVLVPHAAVHTDYATAGLPGAGALVADSNGLASGNHLLEAVVHGLCEVIERDASALFDRYPAPEQHARRLDPAQLAAEDPDIAWLVDRFEAGGVRVGLWDMTSDVGVPAVLCHTVDGADDPFRPLPGAGGMGAHPEPRHAVVRALTEAAQSRLIHISGARDDLLRSEYERAADPAGAEALRQVLSDFPAGTRPPPQQVLGAAQTLGELVEGLVDLLAAADLTEVVVVNLTRPEIGLPVVRVVVPGLEGAASSYGGQTLPGPRALAADAMPTQPMAVG